MRLNIPFAFRPIRRNTLIASVSYSLEEGFGSPVSALSMTAWCPYLLVCRIRLVFRKAKSEHLRKQGSKLAQKRKIGKGKERQDKIIFLKQKSA